MAQNEPQRKETPPGPSPNSPSLLFEYQCTSGKFIGLANRIESKKNRFGSQNRVESKLFLPELECSSCGCSVAFALSIQVFDPGLVLYLYESPPGYALLALRLIGWVWFSYAVFVTVKRFPRKVRFYIPLYVFYTVW